MSGNTYRPVSDRAKALHGDKPFEAEFTALEERDQLEGGHLEIVPRAYKILSNNFTAAAQGEVVDLALPVETEAALIQGGHLQLTDSKPAKKAIAKKTATKKAAAKKAAANPKAEDEKSAADNEKKG